MAEKGQTFLRLLGLGVDATEKDIKNAYRKLARDLHPDKNPSPEAAKLFVEVKKAHEYLIENHKRVEIKVDQGQAAKAKEAYKNRKSTKSNRWGAPVEKASTSDRKRTFEQPEKKFDQKPKRDTSYCANPHKIRFKWDREKFK